MDLWDKKDYSVKVSLSKGHYHELKEIAYELEISMKKLVNQSIKKSLKDIEVNGYYKRSKKEVYVIDKEFALYSLKVKSKHYKELQRISNETQITVKGIVEDILSVYPAIVQDELG
jgi:predicted DNA-binding ribbon-helix-helix protein